MHLSTSSSMIPSTGVTQWPSIAIMAEITASTNEQSTSINEVGQAVAQLDQMTQQNAALVEESAAAAQSLKDQSVRLSEVVGTFRLSTDASHTAPRLSAPGG